MGFDINYETYYKNVQSVAEINNINIEIPLLMSVTQLRLMYMN